MADAESKLQIVIGADTSDAEQKLGGFGGTLAQIGKVAAGIGLERLAENAIQFGKDFVTSSVSAYNESQKLVTQLDAVEKSTKEVAGVSKDFAINLSKSLEESTTFSDEAVLSAENLLLTFTNIGKNVFPDATKTVLDMATALGEDTKSASIQLGKALQDPILGVTALRRVGVNFNDDQKKLIETMVKSGNSLGAQKLILAELAKEFGGSATAAATTWEGKMKQVGNTIDNIKEIFGKLIVGALYPLTNAIKPVLDGFLKFLEGSQNINSSIQVLTKNIPFLSTNISGLSNVYSNISKIMTTVFNTMNKLWEAHKTEIMAALKELMPFIQGTLDSIWSLIQVVWNLIGAYVIGTLQSIQDFWNVWGAGIIQATKGLLEIILGAFKLGLDLITGVLNIFMDIFKGNWGKLWNDVKSLFTNIINDIKGIFQGFANFVMGIVNGIINAVKNIGSSVSNAQSSVGKRASGGMASGLTLVGENGPELVSLPVGSYVYKNSDTQRMMGNYAPVININNPTVRNNSDIQAIAAEVQRVLGRQNELARLGGI